VLHLAVNASIFTLALIGFNRYLSVCRPSLYKKVFTTNATVVLCLATWGLSGFQGLVPAFKIGHTEYHYRLQLMLVVIIRMMMIA
jgi:uncharacterized protein (DUF486 family)